MFELIVNWVHRQFPESSTDDAFALAQHMYSIVELDDSYGIHNLCGAFTIRLKNLAVPRPLPQPIARDPEIDFALILCRIRRLAGRGRIHKGIHAMTRLLLYIARKRLDYACRRQRHWRERIVDLCGKIQTLSKA